MGTCPGCGDDTEDYTIIVPLGTTTNYLTDTWCPKCLADKVRKARSGRICRCSEFEGVHTHPYKPNGAEEVEGSRNG